VRQYLVAVYATVRRDAAIFVSYRFRSVTQILTVLFSMTMFYYVSKLVRPGVVGPHSDYFAYVVVGIVSLAILTAALNMSRLVQMELFAGTFERIVISPAGPVVGVVSLAVFPVLYAIVLAGVMLTAASVIFGFPIQVDEVPAALAVAGLGALAFTCIGLLFVACLLVFKSATGSSWVITALSILGGIYFPLRLFPVWIRWLSDVQPFTPSVDLLRHLLLGTPSIQPAWLELVKLGAFSAGLLPISAAVLWFAVHVSRRRGTLMEF